MLAVSDKGYESYAFYEHPTHEALAHLAIHGPSAPKHLTDWNVRALGSTSLCHDRKHARWLATMPQGQARLAGMVAGSRQQTHTPGAGSQYTQAY